jgi:hypothetical protein
MRVVSYCIQKDIVSFEMMMHRVADVQGSMHADIWLIDDSYLGG